MRCPHCGSGCGSTDTKCRVCGENPQVPPEPMAPAIPRRTAAQLEALRYALDEQHRFGLDGRREGEGDAAFIERIRIQGAEAVQRRNLGYAARLEQRAAARAPKAREPGEDDEAGGSDG